MRKQVLLGLIIIVGAPVLLLGSYFLGVIRDLYSVLQAVIIVVVASMVLTGGSFIWRGIRPDEQANLRKQRIHVAIKKWVELPIIQFRDKRDTLPLAEKPPELAAEIEQCLSRKYRGTVYASLQKFRQEYHDWKDGDSSAMFTKVVEGRTIVNVTDTIKWDEFKQRELIRLHSQLAELIKSEILDKDHTRLKC